MVRRGMKETRLPGKQNTIMSSHDPRDVSLTPPTAETSTVISTDWKKADPAGNGVFH